MIIENGTIQVRQKTGGGVDLNTGYARRSSAVAWGDPIPCQFYPNRYTNLGRVNGEHVTSAEYTVLIDEQPFVAEQIRITNNAGGLVGEFSIISCEPLEAVGQIKIIV